MDYKDLTEEQKAKVSACKSPEELIALAKEEGVVLTEDQLEGIAGGWDYTCASFGDWPED